MVTPTDSNHDPTTGKPPRPRRRIPVSLRLFLASLLLVGVGSVLWIGIPVYRQHMAIQEVERLGGNVDTEPGAREWLREWWDDGDEISPIDDVVAVDLGLERITDADLHVLGAFPQLRELRLSDSQITDVGLTQVSRCDTLRKLDLRGTQITEAGLEKLTGLICLEQLGLPDLKLTEPGLLELCKLPTLEIVTLDGDGEPENAEFVDIAEARGFDLYFPSASHFQRLMRQSLRGRKKTVLVHCHAASDLEREDPSIAFDLAKYVSYQLNGAKIKVVDPDRLFAWLDKHDEWRKTSELGAAFHVDYIVQIDLDDYSLTETDGMNLHRGRAMCIVNVMKMDETKTNGNVIYTVPILSTFPKDGPLDQHAMTETEFKKRYLSFLSDEIGQLFYPFKFYPAKVARMK